MRFLPMLSHHRLLIAARLLAALLLAINASALVARAADADESSRLISDQAQAVLQLNVTISASMAGEIAEINVVEGQRIAQAESIAKLDDAVARAEWLATKRAHEAALLEATNDVDARFAQRSLEVRLRELEQSESANTTVRGTVSETEIDRLRLVVDQSRLAIEQAEHQQKVAMAQAGEKEAVANAANVRVQKHAIVAPRDATVAELFVQVGQRVDAGEPIARLIDLRTLRIECLVNAALAKETRTGEPVRFEFENNQACTGKIEFVSPEIHPVTGQVRILATVENPDSKLRPGTRGRLVALGKESPAKTSESAKTAK